MYNEIVLSKLVAIIFKKQTCPNTHTHNSQNPPQKNNNKSIMQYLYLPQVEVVLMVRVKNLCVIQYLYLMQVDV